MRQSRTIFAIFAITLLLSAEARIATADKWNFDLSFRFMDALAAKQPSLTPAEKASIQKVLAIRNARAEVAIGIAAQKAPGMLAAYRNILNRMICINTVAFEGQPENKIFGGLFALPGSEYEATWTAQDKCKGKAFAKLDDDRWGPFLTKTDLAGNTADVKAAIAGDNVRSHMHLLARASLYGECGAIDNWDKIATHVPGSFRHALMIIKATPAKMTKAKADCKLNEAKLLHQTSRVIRGKNIIEFEDTSARTADGVAPGPTNVAEARKPRSPNFRSMRVMKNGVAFNPPSVPVAGWNGNTWTQARLVGTDQPPLSAGEQAFIRANDPTWTIDKAPPLPGAGGNVFDMKETADGQNTKGNSLWRNAMIANGFLMDAGPSGTTDEIAQFGDLTSVTNDLAGACGVRYGPLSGMLLQTHHSFAEVVQGMGDGNRAAPIFSFKAPYDSIKVCADGFFDSAVKKFKDLSRPGDAQAALVLGSDFGVVTEGGVAKPRNEAASDTPAHTKFRIEDEGADGTVFNNKVCILGPQNFPTGASGWEMLCAASPTWAQVASKFAEVDEEDEAVEDEAEEDEDAEDEEEDEADEEDEEEEEDLEFLEEETEDEEEDEETEETEFLEEEEEEEEEDEEEEEEEF